MANIKLNNVRKAIKEAAESGVSSLSSAGKKMLKYDRRAGAAIREGAERTIVKNSKAFKSSVSDAVEKATETSLKEMSGKEMKLLRHDRRAGKAIEDGLVTGRTKIKNHISKKDVLDGYKNPVDKSRLRELRSKFAEETKGFSRAGASNFDGSKTEKVLNKQNKIYANRQYNKEMGRLKYDLNNGSVKERIGAAFKIGSTHEKDFMPKTKGQSSSLGFDKGGMAYRAAAAGVGGALIFSMANNKGQQSNEQLYGQ